ncbi:hypothetical protein HX049_05090 [Myroides odoratimimus]|uniref:hypothetical protein n=1 Tax=Myroides odoratimimus TaxID=76832 RepID=UPI0025752107|nr:hypothetical protein [Myroides odoratimimus]MDM1396544.1 hypothetical protein [Myroides odoratimimus]
MQSNKKIQELGKKLPHGAKKKIAKETGLSYNTVVTYFLGANVGYFTEAKILKEAKIYFDLLEEAEKAKEELLKYGL